jgi:YVTN family beta-propeller protein
MGLVPDPELTRRDAGSTFSQLRVARVCAVIALGLNSSATIPHSSMLHRFFPRIRIASLASAAFFSVTPLTPAAPSDAGREPGEDVNSAAVREKPGLKPDAHILFNGWGMTPAGEQVRVSDMALKMVVSPDKKMLVAVSGGFNKTGLTLIHMKTRQVAQFLPLRECWNGLAFSKDGRRIFVSGGDRAQIFAFNYADGKAELAQTVSPDPTVPPQPVKTGPPVTPVFLASIAVHPSSGKLYVCNEANHEVWVVNPDTLKLETVVPVGQFPHTCVFGLNPRYLYVSNWGSRSVSIVDVERNRRLRDISVGLRPNDMALARDGRLFIACAGDNSVHVISTAKIERAGPDASPERRLWESAREVISTSLYPQSPEGSTPDAVAVSPDGKALFVANADNNSVMVVDISNSLAEDAKAHGESVSVVNGFIPVGWYPTALAVSPDNNTLFVANGKGLASAPNSPARPDRDQMKLHRLPAFTYIPRTLDGAVSFIARPDTQQMAAYTEQVRRNSPYRPEWLTRAPIQSNSAVPAKVGEPCPIKHVLYIIKENRTYDQVLGDMTDAKGNPIGNGDPDLTLYGERITPNQHELAREFVLLDNLYCNGEVSVDGHSWCDAAIATDFRQRAWILSYSKHGKLAGNEEMDVPANGYIWDLCKRHGLSYRNYGEGIARVPSANRGRWSNPLTGRDMDTVQFWIDDLKKAEQTGDLPRFTIMSLGEDHTKGTSAGAFTPDACVASNDLGLGRIVEAASRSRFWKEMAIFVIEDDAQNGPDHVDAHRTIGFVISPWCKRHAVDSTLYTTASMVRTIELILGLPPLTQYDAGATPMFNCFQKTPTLTPYAAREAAIDLFATNGKTAPYAKQSARMNFKDYDRAPEDELNRILWHAAKGDAPYPAPIHRALFTR